MRSLQNSNRLIPPVNVRKIGSRWISGMWAIGRGRRRCIGRWSCLRPGPEERACVSLSHAGGKYAI